MTDNTQEVGSNSKIGGYLAPTKWQQLCLERLDKELQSGIAWHPAAAACEPVATTGNLRDEITKEVCSWFLQLNNTLVDVRNKDTRLSFADVEKLIPQMVAEKYGNSPAIQKSVRKIAESAFFGCSPNPTLSFGVYSGKAYPKPGNASPSLYRKQRWDINTWHEPEYRRLASSENTRSGSCPFSELLAFAISDQRQRNHLLDWISWCLQNEAQKPTWSVLLYSEEKGTGKSTIGEVLEALFGSENTAPVNGIEKLTQRFAADVLGKKLIVAEEVHISSNSIDGNALKDLITNERITVEPKYQSAVTIPQVSCFLFTTNHKPLWLEGGERRYYVIEMSHEGHAQGSKNLEFSGIVARVKAQIGNPQSLRDLYERLMARGQDAAFNPKNLDFSRNATPIMRDLQATSGNEVDEMLNALLQEFHVSIIPSSDFPELASYIRCRNANSLRNSLVRLGWEERRLRINGKQGRTWVRKDLDINNKRVNSPELAKSYGGDAVDKGYTWFSCDFFQYKTWDALVRDRLPRGRKITEEYSAFADGPFTNDSGDFGPFCGAKSNERYQTLQGDRGEAPTP
jgi:hypothetical protein